jgi:hypothetical protein
MGLDGMFVFKKRHRKGSDVFKLELYGDGYCGGWSDIYLGIFRW